MNRMGAHRPIETGQEAREYISSRSVFGIKPGLSRTVWLLDAMGHPERGLRFLHIAGTNGKGSTCALLYAICEAAGMRTGLYTSPSLAGFEDRVVVRGMPIGEDRLVYHTRAIATAIASLDADSPLQPTAFEVATVLAFCHFADQKADVVVLETGLGGRYDATNVVVPLVSAITNVSMDHMEILGDTIEKIASDKAGIIKQGRPVVTAASGAALGVIANVAREMNSPLVIYGRDFRSVEEERSLSSQRFSYWGRRRDLLGANLSLLGPHQVVNASVALAVVELARNAGLAISDDAVRAGLRQVVWPGRFEVAGSDPLIFLDGAHNEAGAIALQSTWETLRLPKGILIVGCLKEKDISAMIPHFAAIAKEVIVTQPAQSRALDADELKLAFQTYQRELCITVADSIADALSIALASRAGKCPICVTGSLYTVAEARAKLGDRRDGVDVTPVS